MSRRYARSRRLRLEGMAEPVEEETQEEDDTAEPDVDPTLHALAATKSYTTSAVIVFFLYLLFWLPGYLFNIVYYNDARRSQALAGESLPGGGCLAAMFYLNTVLLALGIVLACFALSLMR